MRGPCGFMGGGRVKDEITFSMVVMLVVMVTMLLLSYLLLTNCPCSGRILRATRRSAHHHHT